MATDSYFVIGSNHQSAGMPCQDYAVHGALHGTRFGIVADGCSASAGRPDIGARLAALSLARAFEMDPAGSRSPEPALLAGLRDALDSGWVGREDLLTTVGGFLVGSEGLQAWLWGDGVMFAVFADGTTEIRVVTTEDNTPFYPIYLLQPDGPRPPAVVNGQPLAGATCCHWDLRDAPRPLTTFIIATDGLAQLQGMDTAPAAAELAEFRTTAGAFLKRRAMRALRAAPPIDDLGLAAYHEDPR
ncbi:protein phosphatase 2C domain-containing protein [uncultured Thiodictyon sp.]|uniref:protein phosphatase 2C domain-containing protein n=1 Tax=uncultured Thiodictyon sp. TaxID=1846217 RepID=UPI0025DCC7D7|nr:protein phosphatase 2C domain-containing protein [uncultured Thiodictyon sp.]